MSMSRSESHQRHKNKRVQRMRKLFAVNLVLLLAIVAIAVVYWLQHDDGSAKLDASSEQGGGNEAPAGTSGNGSNASGGSGGQGDGNSPNRNGNGGVSDDKGSGNDAAASGGANHGVSGNGASGDGATGDGATGVDGSSQGTNGEDEGALAGGGVVSGDADGSVNLAFAGDVLLAASVEKLMLKNGYEYPYAKVLPFLRQPDIMAVNLETPVTLRGTPAQNKQYVYKSSPDALPALIDAGIDVVNLANNHTLDQGEEGLLDTIDSLARVKLPNMGAGRNDTEAYKPVIKEVNGVSIAYLGLTRVIPVTSWKAGKNHPGLAESYDPTQALAAIKQAKEKADIVVVMVHWGTELMDMPNADQTRLGHAYIDAGADLVIGGHPHVMQGFESYKGKWIAYSLGNFIFSGMPDPRTGDTGVLDAACDASGNCSLQLHPMRAVQSQPAPLENQDAEALLKRIAGISIHAQINEFGQILAKE